jgi:hypothetical protein
MYVTAAIPSMTAAMTVTVMYTPAWTAKIVEVVVAAFASQLDVFAGFDRTA